MFSFYRLMFNSISHIASPNCKDQKKPNKLVNTRDKMTQEFYIRCQEQKGMEGKELDDFIPILPEACCNCLDKPFNLCASYMPPPGAKANLSRELCEAS